LEGNEARVVQEYFFEVTRWNAAMKCTEHVLTPRAEDVVLAEIEEGGIVTGRVLGTGTPKRLDRN
jgi:hypothetical protein